MSPTSGGTMTIVTGALATLVGLIANTAMPLFSSDIAAQTPSLAGTAWQLMKFQGGDGTILTPDDPAKYTVEFESGGRLNARIDCNRGRGTWTSAGVNQVQFGALALTRAMCPTGSLHDQIVKHWGYIRSYVIKDGRLSLSLMADGGIYEFEPAPQSKPATRVLEVSSVALETNADLSSLIAEVRRQADAFVFLSGGASKMRDDHQRQLLAMFEALALVAKSGRRIAVGDGGTQAGIMEAAGQARRAGGNLFPLIGVAPAREIVPRGTTPIDPNHSHVVAVDNPSAPAQDSWGSETEAMYWLFAKLSEGRPSVALVANGGGITLNEVDANVRAGRRMILIKGSGRAADALVSLVEKTQVSDPEVSTLRERAGKAMLMRRPDLFQIVPLQDGAAGLRDAITTAIRDR